MRQEGTKHLIVDVREKWELDVANLGPSLHLPLGDLPARSGELPKDVIALNWGYDRNHPFEKETRAFADAGVKYCVCPGTSSWASISGQTDNAIANLRSAAEHGLNNGAIGYLKTDDGIFQQGGPWKPLYMVGLDYRVPLWTKWDLLISGRVDGHSFTTDELKAQGFTNSQGVQRVFLGVGLAGVRK